MYIPYLSDWFILIFIFIEMPGVLSNYVSESVILEDGNAGLWDTEVSVPHSPLHEWEESLSKLNTEKTHDRQRKKN